MAESTKHMTTAASLSAITRRASPSPGYADPLATVLQLIQQTPDTSECRALRKLLEILATKHGTFREAEAWLFSGESAGLTAALIDARFEGRYSDEEWQRAYSS